MAMFRGFRALVCMMIYFFFIKNDKSETDLISSSSSALPSDSATQDATSNQQPLVTGNFPSLLLNIKTIQLNDSIFSDSAFNNLRDNSIVLIPDGNEGRPNPFAPIGTDSIEATLVGATETVTVPPTTTTSASTSTTPKTISIPITP